jgi:MoaA/NifB/PqqE/SkfB family radical SAM enzyme
METITAPALFDLLAPKPYGLMIEITSKCNLRCVYCPKSLEGNDDIPGRNEDMLQAVVEGTAQLITESSFSELLLAGTGETTFHPGWQAIVKDFVIKGKSRNPQSAIMVNSNLANDYSDSDLDTLLLLDIIVISIDTIDPATTRSVRRKSSIEKIFFNISKLTARAASRSVRKPQIVLNCTLTDRVHKDIRNLFLLAGEFAVDRLTISDVQELGELPGRFNFSSVTRLPHHELVALAKDLNDCITLSQQSEPRRYPAIQVQGSLIQLINERLSNPDMPPASEAAPDTHIAEGHTRICLQPWTRFTIGANGDVFPCCVTLMDPLTTLQKDPNPFYSDSARAFREGLIRGGKHVPEPCRACTNAPVSPVSSLASRIMTLA